jgi:puromycin-sensitive aminopeptidase
LFFSVAVLQGQTLKSSSVSVNEADEVLTLVFPSAIPVGKAELRIQYTGILNDQMRGFYLSKYTDAKGLEQRIATTQFEATDCRRALPSWDEPALKAVFSVTLDVPCELLALSNMPAESATPLTDADAGLTRHVFAPTPLMSTYLLAFVVGRFDCIEGKTSEGTLVRCFATPGKGEQNRFALDFAIKLLPFYNKCQSLQPANFFRCFIWPIAAAHLFLFFCSSMLIVYHRAGFETPYPLPHLCMIAIPDFSAGQCPLNASFAQGNWHFFLRSC